MRKPPSTRTTLIATALALIVTLALALNLTPLLRGGAGWRWPYEVPTQPLRLLPGLIALALYLVIGEGWLARRGAARLKGAALAGFLAFCLLGGLTVQLAFLRFYGNPFEHLFLRTVSMLSGGFFEVGVAIQDVPTFLHNYTRLMPTWPAHPKAHPPGTVLSFWGVSKLFALFPGLANSIAGVFRRWQCHHRVLMALSDPALSAATLGMILPLLGGLAILPAYDLARRLYDRQTALRAALWLPLIPAFVMFTPQWNQFFMLPMVLGLWLVHRALAEGKPLLLGLAGLLMSAATYLSFTNVNLVGLLGVYGLLYVLLVGRRTWARDDWRRMWLGVALFIVTLPLAWLIHYAATGVSVFEILSTALTIHYGLNEPYLPWLAFFPIDLILFSGVILAFLATAGIVRAVRALIDEPRQPHPEAVLPLALAVGVLGLNFSGLVRGEVGRLLLWLMPVIAIVGARAVESGERKRWEPWVASAALAVQLVVMVGFLRVIGTELAPPPDPPFIAAPSPEEAPAQATFDGKADLIGVEAALAGEGDSLDLTLRWRAVERFDHPYFISAILVGPEGAVYGVNDWLPVDGGYPTSCWRPGEVVVDHTLIPLDAPPPPGDYWLSLSMFEFDTRARLPVDVPGQGPDEQVGVGPIHLR
jgi:hypothetical protein